MTVKELAEKLGLKIFSGNNGTDRLVEGAYVSDLLSDVMGNAGDEQVWVTLQTHKNIMAVASLKDLPAIILVKGLLPNKDTIEFSDKENIPILGTDKQTFEISGQLYELLNNKE